MKKGKTPGSNTGNNGGIFQEQGPRGGKTDNYCATSDNKPLPPTSTKGATWIPVKRTPDSNK